MKIYRNVHSFDYENTFKNLLSYLFFFKSRDFIMLKNSF